MPADGRPRPVLGHQHLLQVPRLDLSIGGRAIANGYEKGWQRLVRPAQAATIEVVAPPKPDDAALGLETMKLEFLEWKAGQLSQQRALALRLDQLCLTAETARQARCSIEQIGLLLAAVHAFPHPSRSTPGPRFWPCFSSATSSRQ